MAQPYLQVAHDLHPPPALTDYLHAPPPPSDEKRVSALTLQEPDVLPPGELTDTTSSEEGLIADSDDSYDGSPPPVSLHGPKILYRSHPDWSQVYYIRMDRRGSFCVYPDLGGPFQSIDEADDAIIRRAYKPQNPSMSVELDKMSNVDRLVYKHMHYADGTKILRKRKDTERPQHYLVQALVEQFNDGHNLLGDLAHELESLVREEWMYENDRWFYHFNFTTKTKEGDDTVSSRYLFFAEVSQHIQGDDAWEVNCCCIINSEDNGHCYGCRNNGTPDMQHPNDIGAYIAGRVDEYLPFGDDECSASDFEDEEAEEARIRHIYKGLDDPAVLEEIYSYFD